MNALEEIEMPELRRNLCYLTLSFLEFADQ